MSAEEKWKEIDEKFRDPSFNIKSIQVMQFEQNEAIKVIKLKLNEISQVTEHLKATNKFKSNLIFDEQKKFGTLFLNEYSTDPFQSQLMTGNQPL
jgi:hypothetical protein